MWDWEKLFSSTQNHFNTFTCFSKYNAAGYQAIYIFGSHVTFHMVNVDILVKAVSANLFMSKARLEIQKI